MRFQLAGTRPQAALQGHRGDRRTGACRRAEDPARRVVGQEDGREPQDQHQSRDDEADPAEDGTDVLRSRQAQ